VITCFTLPSRAAIEAAARRNIRFVADDRIEPRVAAGDVELERAVQVAVIGNRQGVHAQLFGPRDKRLDRARSIQEAVMAMAMQMSKWRRRHRKVLLSQSQLDMRAGARAPSAADGRLPVLERSHVILSLRVSTRHEAHTR
jgi:hypothetical protein